MPEKLERKLKRKAKKRGLSKKNEPPPLSMERYARLAGSQKRKRRNFVAKYASKYNRSETHHLDCRGQIPELRKELTQLMGSVTDPDEEEKPVTLN